MTRPAPAPDAGALVASLQRIMPPAALIHVGVGRGAGAMHQWRDWEVADAWLIDAEPAQLAWTETLAASRPGWKVCPAMLAEADGQATYYRASNPAESGLVPTAKLASLWPNLRQGEQAERPTTRLDTLLAGAGALPDGAGWWLIVDCLPALRVLQGAPDTLERCSVLWLRTLLQPLPDAESGTTLDELQAFLAPLGFRCVQLTESNHPALGEALFVRDWAQRLAPVVAELRASNAQQQQEKQALCARLASQEAAARASVQERDAQAGLVAEGLAKLEALAGENAGLSGKLAAEAKRYTEVAGKLAQLEQERAAGGEALKAAQADLAARTGERDVLAKEKAELNAKLGAETKRHTELAAKLAQLEKDHAAGSDALKATQAGLAACTAERDALAKEKTEVAARLASLEKEHGAKDAALKAVQAELATRTTERDAQAKLVAERQAQLDALGKEKTALAEQLAAANAAKQDLAKRGETMQVQLDGLTKARDEQARLASERAAQLAQLTTQGDKLSVENQSLKAELAARDGTIGKQNEQIAEQDQRERQLVEEIVRAEAQIELIKDLLLREGGL